VNLAGWAEKQGISRTTAYAWFRAGKLPVPARKVGGLILVEEHHDDVPAERIKTVVYARVSSADRRPDLDRQVARVMRWARRQEYLVDEVVSEVGSALGGHRHKFLRLVRDPGVGRIIVEHRDRFARFGFEYVEAALSAQGRELIVVDPAEVDDDLAGDLTEILASFCARLYGARSAVYRAKRMVAAAAVDREQDAVV